MIEVEHLTKRYGPITAVEDISFSVEKGEIMGFLGPNGAGKSTTMRILTGFFPATEGTARIAGHDVHKDPISAKRCIGYMPENVPIYGEMVVRSYLKFIGQIRGVARGQMSEEIDRAIERAGLTEMAYRLIGNLSKGYRQRVGLAQALMGNPPVLILDEPTSGLDPAQIVEIREMIRGLRNEHTVLISTHILPEVTMLCSRVVLINRGRVVLRESLEDLTGPDARSLEEVFIEVVSQDAGAPA